MIDLIYKLILYVIKGEEIMRNLLYICFFVLTGFLYLSSQVTGEQKEEIENIEELWIIEFARADVRETREKFIDSLMNLSPEQQNIFNPIFKKYEDEFKKIGDERLRIIMEFEKNYASMTDSIAKDLAKSSIDVRKKRLDLMEKYYDKFSKALDSIVAARFLQLENYINLIVDIQIAEEVPLIKKQ